MLIWFYILYLGSFLPSTSYYSDLTLSQAFQPMATQLSFESCAAIGWNACDSIIQFIPYLIPVGSSWLCPRLKPCEDIPVVLLMQDLHRHLQPHALHVVLAQGSRHEHLHLQKAVEALVLVTVHLQLSQKAHEPLETLLITVDPDKVHLERTPL